MTFRKNEELIEALKSIDTSKMSVNEIWNLPLEGMDMFQEYNTFWAFLKKSNIPYKKKHDTIFIGSPPS